MLPEIPGDWQTLLAAETRQPYYQALEAFLAREQAAGEVLPATAEIYAALAATPYHSVKVVVLGQDPYPTPGHAHGLAFSVKPEVRPLPGSLRNIYRELADDIEGFTSPGHGFLQSWAAQGVLLLNTVLTVRAGAPNSHAKHGWEHLTDAVIRLLNERAGRIVFVLWGRKAQAKTALINAPQHRIVACAHPSPLSVKQFLGSKPFSQVNAHLAEAGLTLIDWRLPPVPSQP